MKVRMTEQINGLLNGVPYPNKGEEFDVPDAAGAKLCEKGYAEPVGEKDSDKAEKRPAAKKSESR